MTKGRDAWPRATGKPATESRTMHRLHLALLAPLLAPAVSAQGVLFDLTAEPYSGPGVLEELEELRLSADGLTVVGTLQANVNGVTTRLGLRWRRAMGIRTFDLPSSTPDHLVHRVTSDGAFILGWGFSGTLGTMTTPWVWDPANGIDALDLAVAAGYRVPVALSDDGRYVFLRAAVSSQPSARFDRWTGTLLPIELQGAPIVIEDCDASGDLAVGWTAPGPGTTQRAVAWREGQGAALLDLPPNPLTTQQPLFVSRDGSRAIGQSNSNGCLGGAVWDLTTGAITQFNCSATPAPPISAASDDGGIVVLAPLGGQQRIWTPAGGAISTVDFVAAAGVALPPLARVLSVSSDGNFLRGRAPDPTTGENVTFLVALDQPSEFPLGQVACDPTAASSTGAFPRLNAFGSRVIGDDELQLEASDLPAGAACLFLCSQALASTPNPAGGQGTLCLGSPVGRFRADLGAASAAGSRRIRVQLDAFPGVDAFVPAASGETWAFQAWFRDQDPGPTSNFSGAVAVRFE